MASERKMPDGVRRGSLADDAYSLSTSPDDEERLMAPDERTSLLAAGDASSRAGSEDQVQPAVGKDSWEGYEEFRGLPWYKQPSVRTLAGEPAPSGDLALTLVLSRFTGCFLHMLSSPWHLVDP
jgi:hypothetical protein